MLFFDNLPPLIRSRVTVRAIILAAALLAAAPSQGVPGPVPVDEGWRQIWCVFGLDPALAESVIWPEMQLYNGIRDFAESTADYSSAVTGGSGFDFSIGVFQMKPSFVRKLESAWMESGLHNFYNLSFDTADTPSVRCGRIERMRIPEWQVLYLGMFLRLLYHSYGSCNASGERIRDGLDALSKEEQVRLAATAYNRGCTWTPAGQGNLDSLRLHAGAVSFPRVIIRTPSTRQYSYASLAWEHYQTIADRP